MIAAEALSLGQITEVALIVGTTVTALAFLIRSTRLFGKVRREYRRAAEVLTVFILSGIGVAIYGFQFELFSRSNSFVLFAVWVAVSVAAATVFGIKRKNLPAPQEKDQ